MNEIQEKETPEKMKQQPLSGHCNYWDFKLTITDLTSIIFIMRVYVTLTKDSKLYQRLFFDEFKPKIFI